jgi:hypothetical protein
LGRLINRFLAPFPVFSSLCLWHYTVCRSVRRLGEAPSTATIVIPARNERGNIEAAIRRMPRFAKTLEIIFVEGHSSDGTWSEIERIVQANPQLSIKAMRQSGKGKANAVRTGFDAASNDVLMILDADLTMPPEQLPKFWEVIQSQKGEFINGSRLTYPLEHESMRFLNLVANKLFSLLFTWLLGQRFTDTLCGTKVLRRSDYVRLKTARILAISIRSAILISSSAHRSWSQNHRGSHPLCQPHLWQDPNFPLSPRIITLPHVVDWVFAHQGAVTDLRSAAELPRDVALAHLFIYVL